MLRTSLIVGLLIQTSTVVAAQDVPTAPDSSAYSGPPVVETRVVVRALSNDAKLIGSGVGGARITIRHAESGAVLAEGVQRGGTGDTGAILSRRPRGDTPFDTEGAAAFRTSLPLAGPTPVEIVAEGPLDTPHAIQRATITLLLIPGRHLEGDGVVLVLHGFTVEFVEAPAVVTPGAPATIAVRVTMLCGCPTEPGGLWDSTGWTMEVELVGPGGAVASAPLEFTGETSRYTATLQVPGALEGDDWTLRAVVFDGDAVNTGMAERRVRVGR